MKTYEGASINNGERVCNVTMDALEELMIENTTILEEFIAWLHALQVLSLGVMTPHLAEGVAEVEQMVCACTKNTLVLLEGIVLVEAESGIRGWGLNFSTLPREMLYQLREGQLLSFAQGRVALSKF